MTFTFDLESSGSHFSLHCRMNCFFRMKVHLLNNYVGHVRVSRGQGHSSKKEAGRKFVLLSDTV